MCPYTNLLNKAKSLTLSQEKPLLITLSHTKQAYNTTLCIENDISPYFFSFKRGNTTFNQISAHPFFLQ